MPRGIKQIIAYGLVALFATGLILIAPFISPTHVELTWLNGWTSVFVLGVAEFAPIHSGQSRYRFRMAAQIPLLLSVGLTSVLTIQLSFIVLYEIYCYWRTRMSRIHSPRILSALVAPALTGALYHGLFDVLHTRRVLAVLCALLVYAAVALVFRYIPGLRRIIHPWRPIRGWLSVLVCMDALMAFGAIVEQSAGDVWQGVTTTLQLVVIIGSFALYTDSSIRRFRLVKLTRLMGKLSQQSTMPEMMESLFEGLQHILLFDVAVFWVLGDDYRLHPTHVHSLIRENALAAEFRSNHPAVPLGVGLVGFVASSKEVLSVASPKEPLLFDWRANRDVRSSALAAPIIVKEDVFGVLCLYHQTGFMVYNRRERELLRIVAWQMESALSNLWRYEQTRLRTQIDELTGLYNYRFFDAALHQMYDKSVEARTPLTLVVIDIDHFKHINDRYGHLAGNEVLVQLAAIFKDMVRETDVLARYGGEEFTVLFPGLESAEALVVAERIRRRVASTPFQVTDSVASGHGQGSPGGVGAAIRLTLSIGIATYPDTADTALSLLRHADRAMYVGAKQSGRNKVSVYA